MFGRYRYTCEDCGADNEVHPHEHNRAARPRCTSCGSIRLRAGRIAREEAAVRETIINEEGNAAHAATRTGPRNRNHNTRER